MKEFIDAYAMKKGVNRVKAKEDVECFLSVLTDSIKSGGVSFKGKFTIKKVFKKGRSGKCNGREYTTEDKNTLKITVGSDLEQELNA